MTHEPLAVVVAQATADPAAIGSVLDFVRKGGVMMVPIVACSLVALAIVVERSVVLRRDRVVPRRFEEDLDDVIQGDPRRRDEGLAWLRARPSPASRVAAAGIEKLAHGREIVEQHLAAAGESELVALRSRLRVLAVVVAIAPLLGLTGTIFGMIKAFQTVAISGEALGKAELLAAGIYEAMITTAAGLLVAMPVLVLHHWLLSRVEQRGRDLDRVAVDVVERLVLEPAVAEREVAPRRGARHASVADRAPDGDTVAAGMIGAELAEEA